MREYSENRSDKSISSNSRCDLGSIILKNNHFKNGKLKYHQKRGFAIGIKFAPPFSKLFTFPVYLSCGCNTLMRLFVYGPKVPEN